MAVHVKQNRVRNSIKVSVCLLWMSQLGFAVGGIGAYLHDMIVNATGSLSSFISRVVESFADSADCASLELDENVII